MRFDLSNLAATAGLLASASTALSHHDIRNSPSDLPLSVLLTSAQTHLAKGETSEALLYYDVAVTKDPNNYLTRFKRATAYLSLGRTSQATDDFEKVLELKPRFESAHLQLAKINLKAGKWAAAKAQYNAANKGPESSEIAELGRAEEAARLAQAAAKDAQWDECVNHASLAVFVASRSSSLRELRARCRFERGEVEEGIGDLHHVLQMRPGDTDSYVLISATSFYGLGDFDNGLVHSRKCLHSDPESKPCKKLYREQRLIQKMFVKAEAQLNKGQSTTAGRTLVGNGDDPGLLTNIREQVANLRQHGQIPLNAKSRLYSQVVEMVCRAHSESNHKEAQKYCEEALRHDPDSFWGLLHRGKLLLKEEKFEAAIEALNQASETRPDHQEKIHPILQRAQMALKRSRTKDYYKVLGVARDADERQIKSAYRKASKQHHPDKAAKQGVNREDAEKKMASINEAYEVLSDAELRGRFDRGDDPNAQERMNPFQGTPFGPFGDGHAFRMFQQQGGGETNFKFHYSGAGAGGPFGF